MRGPDAVPQLTEAGEETPSAFQDQQCQGPGLPSGTAAFQPYPLHSGMAHELKQTLQPGPTPRDSDLINLGYSSDKLCFQKLLGVAG